MILTTASPREIDEQLAALYRRASQAEQLIAAAVIGLHHALGERALYRTRNRREWPTTTEQAVAAVRELGDTRVPRMAGGYTYADQLAKYTRAVDALAAARAEADPLDTEYARRPWPRFFVVQAHNGHVHSSMHCKTCNRNGVATDFGWNPALSGLSEAEAVAVLGPMLCTVCFPTAPVEWTIGRPAAATCDGSGKSPVKGSEQQFGGTWHGQCPTCNTIERTTMHGALRKHKPAA